MKTAIVTKYLGPTEKRGVRIKATASMGQSVTLSRDYELDISRDHERVANALREKMGWSGRLIGGGLANGDYAWVFAREGGE